MQRLTPIDWNDSFICVLREKDSKDLAHDRVVVDRVSLHFADGSQEASFAVDSRLLQTMFQRLEQLILITTQLPGLKIATATK